MTRLRNTRFVLFLLFTVVTACQPRTEGLNESSPGFEPSQTSPVAASPLSPSSTPIIVLPLDETPPEETPTGLPLPSPTATADALQLFFPTLGPDSGTEHRPPLYPIPWAISPFDHFYFARPIAANYPGELLGDFRYGGVYFRPNEVHSGADIPAPRGTPVLAAGPGTVVWAGIGLFAGSPYYLSDPYGLAVAIRHDFGYQEQSLFTVYAHMSEIEVTVGEWLNTGDELGKVGDTGFTTGPHLHFEVRMGANDFYSTRNPELWLVPAEGWGVLVGRLMNTSGILLDSFSVILHSVKTNQEWIVKTYGPNTVNSDTYYRENMVLSDLPAGVYELNVPYGGLNNKVLIQILPGQVTYFSFKGFKRYNFDLPPAPIPDSIQTPTP